ncbi:MAG: DNA polymerase III subunit beta [Candidatus Nanopelagicales bacterium]
MKIRVERDALADAVAWSARTLPNRPSLPVLAGLMVEAAGDSVSLSGFDYEVSTRAVLEATVESAGTTLVSGRLLSDIARSLPAQPVVITLEGNRVTLTCGRSSFTLPTLPLEDYPALPTMPESSGSVDAGLFGQAVSQVAIAAGRDDTLPTLTGIRVEVDGSTLVLAATDRYRLAVRELQWSPTDSGVHTELLVPAKTLADTAKSLSGGTNVTLALPPDGERLMGFEGDNRRTTTRLLDGEFPKYRSLLPNESSTHAIVDTAALIDAVKRVALVAERNTPVRLAFADSEVALRAGAGDDAKAEESLEASLEGEAIEIAFNPGYLLDGLAAMNAPSARFAFTQATRPAVVTGMDDNSVIGEYQYLLMPVRLTG